MISFFPFFLHHVKGDLYPASLAQRTLGSYVIVAGGRGPLSVSLLFLSYTVHILLRAIMVMTSRSLSFIIPPRMMMMMVTSRLLPFIMPLRVDCYLFIYLFI